MPFSQFFSRWRATRDVSHQLDALLHQARPDAPLGERNTWLMEFGYWLRRSRDNGDRNENSERSFSEHTRLRFLLQVLDNNEDLARRFAATLRSILRDNDARSLFTDTGMPARPGLFSELINRLQLRLLPMAPNRAELSVVFDLLFASEDDAEWVATLDPALLERLRQHVMTGATAEDSPGPELSAALADSIVLLCNQITAQTLQSAIRLRLGNAPELTPILMRLPRLAHELLIERPDNERRAALYSELRNALANAQVGLDSVYDHLEKYGVSVDVVFQVERTLRRIQRVKQLLRVWGEPENLQNFSTLAAQLIDANQRHRSIRALLRESYSLLGRKVVERSAETGEHYIARSRGDYFDMLRKAAGGGVLTAATVYIKFLIAGLHLHKFAEGVFASLNYAGSFLAIHFAHFTLATKQPAMTAPALARQLDHADTEEGRIAFADETIALIRSQVAAIVGNLSLVFPVALAVQLLFVHVLDTPLLSPEKAAATIDSFSLFGWTPLFAAFTGVLLWLSSLTAGWADNWFALHRLGDGIAYHRRLNWVFGPVRMQRYAQFVSRNVAGVVSNVSLGFMLGLLPPILEFIGLPLEVRHVTLSTGSVAAAVGVLGWSAVHSLAFWLASAGIAVMGTLNLAVSFALAYNMAIRSRSLQTSERRQLSRDVLRRIWQAPGRLFFPPRD